MTTEEVIFVKLHIPLHDAGGRQLPSKALREVEDLLHQRFGGFSTGTGEGVWRGATGTALREPLRTYELAAPRWRRKDVLAGC